MSCKHGNHEDACDICDEVSAAYESGLAARLAAPAVANAELELLPLPQFNCAFADHSYPAYNKHAMIAYGQACAAAALAAQAPKAALTDEQIQAIWNEMCVDTPKKPGWCRHIRYARAIEVAAAPNAALVEALKGLVDHLIEGDEEGLIGHAEPMVKARAALAAAEVKP